MLIANFLGEITGALDKYFDSEDDKVDKWVNEMWGW